MPPTFWPAAAEQFRASLAYRQEREQRAAKAQIAKTDGPTTKTEAVTKRPELPPTRTAAANENTRDAHSPIQLTSFNDAPTPIDPPRSVPETVVQSPPTNPRPVAPSPIGWQALTQSAADDLERQVAAAPASTAEIHEHVTLRMLRLLHGDTERALAPIPGLSPTEQDYWSRQTFALATYLDHHAQPDDKRRAATSALHLEEALGSLREVGSLSLRNLTFCKKVVGFGAYEPHDANRFSPGQPLTLYVEVENYHSESTDKGFVTLLGSSYELLDETGGRVGGDSFPDVEDTCRSRRRDFHIQYGLTLPAKLEPGMYRLQLTIRDRQGDKIGKSSVEFEVAGATPRESTSTTAKSAN
jgi:hypothetical protein